MFDVQRCAEMCRGVQRCAVVYRDVQRLTWMRLPLLLMAMKDIAPKRLVDRMHVAVFERKEWMNEKWKEMERERENRQNAD